MKSEDLRLDELIQFSHGSISMQGRRLILHDLHAFGHFRKDLIHMVGIENTQRILTRFGYFAGQADAAAMKRVFEWDNTEELLRAGPKMQSIQGVALAELRRFSFDQHSERLFVEVVWDESAEADEHIAGMGISDRPVCWILSGYISGYTSFCLKKKIYFIETKCRGRGDQTCSAIGKDVDSWGEELTPHIKYFEAGDIYSKIMVLTKSLKEKTAELERQRRLYAPIPKIAMESHSESFRKIIILANRVAEFDTSVLVTGETGTGKEVIARYIHSLSPRSKNIFQTVNCAALPETLLESELFGHKAGSFTGATKSRIGLFEQAAGGTILLDEIGETSPALQVKLLRVLQEKEVLAVGENHPRKIDVRIIASTNRKLQAEVDAGNFRADLFYRLRVMEIHIPPLRERRDDILPLARRFVKKTAKRLKIAGLQLDAKCVDILLEYNWPGNVRELENAIEHAAVMTSNRIILPEHLPPQIARKRALDSLNEQRNERDLESATIAHIESVLKSVNGNRSKAARILKISPVTLWRKLNNR